MLYDKLKKYSENGAYPFHMPGHKRTDIIGDGTLPYKIDLTEIHDFDYLHDPCGCINAVEKKAAGLYHVHRAFMLINGATGGILAAVRAMTHPGDSVLIARNCHKSVYHAAELCAVNAEYFIPDEAGGYHIYGSVNPFLLDITLSQNPEIKLVIITSPTYEGVCSDIEAIVRVCHHHGAKLLVDEAHGAHFPFHTAFPKSAIQSGADVSVISLHKTLPSLTQTALLLTNDIVLEKPLQKNLAVFETSSPSYILMSAIEKCLDFVSDNPSSFDEYVNHLAFFHKRMLYLEKLELLFHNNTEISNLADYDIGKLVISTSKSDISGIQLSNILRKNYNIELEMSASDYAIAMTSVCDTKEALTALADALIEIDSQIHFSLQDSRSCLMTRIPKKQFEAHQGFAQRSEVIPFEHAQNRISLEYIYAYPPGIPLVVPGEVIGKDTMNIIKTMQNSGVEVNSSEKNLPENITVTEL